MGQTKLLKSLANRFNPEALKEYETLLRQLQESFAPANFHEAMLVERMAVAWWRLGRALRFELRETRRATRIAGELIPEHADEPAAYDLLFDLLRENPDEAAVLINKSVQILSHCIENIAKEGDLDEFCLTELQQVPGGLWQRLMALSESDNGVHIHFVVKTADGYEPANPGSAENKAARLLKEEWDNFVRWSDVCSIVRRVPELQAVLRRPDLPYQGAVELLLRYEPPSNASSTKPWTSSSGCSAGAKGKQCRHPSTRTSRSNDSNRDQVPRGNRPLAVARGAGQQQRFQ